MSLVAGADGTPDGWAVVTMDADRWHVRKVPSLSEIFDDPETPEIVAIDVPIGLCDAYEAGGRSCDRAARKYLKPPRASSVFPAPVRCVLSASSWEEACFLSCGSAPNGKRISKQTFAILPKIKEVDNFLRARPTLRNVVREVHPEVCFCELADGHPMTYSKGKSEGRDERRRALGRCFHDLAAIERAGLKQGLPVEDILDAAIACWSALRLAKGKGRSLVEPVPHDTTGLQMTIWV